MKGVLWYSRKQWDSLREASPETDDLGDDYLVWREATEAHVESLEHAGHQVIRVDVNARALESWCREHQLPLSVQARARYAIEQVGSELILARKVTVWRKVWKLWLAMLLPCVMIVVVSKWFWCSPFASPTAHRSYSAIEMLATVLWQLSGLAGMGVGLFAGVQSLRHRGAARREYVRAGAVAILAVSLVFAVRWVNTALERNAIERATARGTALVEAIARYHDERGRPPRTLSELVPEYVKSVPSTGVGVCLRFFYRPPKAAVSFEGKPAGMKRRDRDFWELSFDCYPVLKYEAYYWSFRPAKDDGRGLSVRRRAQLGRWTSRFE